MQYPVLAEGAVAELTDGAPGIGLAAAGDIVENRPATSQWHPDLAAPSARLAIGPKG